MIGAGGSSQLRQNVAVGSAFPDDGRSRRFPRSFDQERPQRNPVQQFFARNQPGSIVIADRKANNAFGSALLRARSYGEIAETPPIVGHQHLDVQQAALLHFCQSCRGLSPLVSATLMLPAYAAQRRKRSRSAGSYSLQRLFHPAMQLKRTHTDPIELPIKL